jgi:hypothetical protein
MTYVPPDASAYWFSTGDPYDLIPDDAPNRGSQGVALAWDANRYIWTTALPELYGQLTYIHTTAIPAQ